MAKVKKPERSLLKVGAIEMAPISSLIRQFGMTRGTATKLLTCLRVPIMWLGTEGYFLVSALVEALFHMLDLGGPGFVAPGSTIKTEGRYRDMARELPKEVLEKTARTHAQKRLDLISSESRARARTELKALLKPDLRGKNAR